MRSWTRLHNRTALLLGDGNASVRRFDAAVEKAYGGKKKIEWFEVYAGETCAARLIEKGPAKAIHAGTVTYDFARLMKEEGRTDVKEIKCSEFGTESIRNME